MDKAVTKLLQKVKSNLKVLTRQMTTELLKRLAAPQVKDYPQDVIGEEGAEGKEEGGSETSPETFDDMEYIRSAFSLKCFYLD